jgi:hypothetical protein
VSAYFSLTAAAPGAAELVLVSGPPYAPFVLVGKDLGSPSWQHQFSGARGTQGRRAASGVPDDRRAVFGLLADDQADKDELAATLADIAAVVDQMRRHGGRVTFREHNQTYRQHLEVLVGEIAVTDWGSQEFNLRDAARPALTFTCGPYLIGDSIDFADRFDTDTLAAGDYVAEAGALANLSVVGGAITPVANLTTENRLIQTARGYAMGDQEVTVKVTPGATITGFKAGVVAKAYSAANRLEAVVTDNGTVSRLELHRTPFTGGFPDTANLPARITPGTPFWVRLSVNGGRMTASYYTTDPELLAPEVAGTTVITTGAQEFGRGVIGRAGLILTPQHAAARLDDLTVRSYLGRPSALIANTVALHRHEGAIPGDAPALADIEVRTAATSPANQDFGLLAWWRRPLPYNLVADGDFERALIRWTVAAVTGFSGAATSIASATSSAALFGSKVGQLVTPATANVGAKFRLCGQFLAGETYTARAWVRAPSGTTPVRLRLGVAGGAPDTVVSAAVALSTVWQELTVTWVPNNDAPVAYVGIEQTTATATTLHIDAVQVYQGTAAPSGAQAQGSGARPPFGVIEAEDNVGVLNFSELSGGSYGGGITLRGTAPPGITSFTAEWMIDPALAQPDDYGGGSLSFVVWAKIGLASQFTAGVTAIVSAFADLLGGAIYTAEFGEAGAQLAIGATGVRYARLGTITLPVSAARPRWTLKTSFVVGAGTNNADITLDYLVLVPARAYVCSPTAKPAAGYPVFLPGSGHRRRVVYSDGSSDRSEGVGPLGRSSGLNGVIELPPGEIETVAITSPVIPDDPAGTTHAIGTEPSPYVRISVRPRWHFLREAP